MKKTTQIQQIRTAINKLDNYQMVEIEIKCESIINLHDKMKNCYFMTPHRNAYGTRSYEESNSRTIIISLDNILYTVEQTTSCSSKNIYYNLEIETDKEVEYNLNISFFKKILKAIEERKERS